MQWAIYVDLEHALTRDQRGAVWEALDRRVPGGGCVGPQRASLEEVYFQVEAPTEDEARTAAARHMEAILAEAGVGDSYEITATISSTSRASSR